ncbi:MAG: tetratricopeptide repeat protein [Cyanobacteria bacterium J06623_5]
MIKHFFRWIQHSLRRFCAYQHRIGLFRRGRRLPYRTIRELQALSAYRLTSRRVIAKRSSAKPAQAALSDGPISDTITYAVRRNEIVHRLNQTLQQDISDGNLGAIAASETAYHQPRFQRSGPTIDPADMAYLAECHGQYQEAEWFYRRSLRVRKEELGNHHPNVAIVLSDLAGLYCQQARYEEAETLLKQALQIQQQAAAEHTKTNDSIETGNSSYRLATLYCQQNRYSEADPLFQTALSIFREKLGSDHPRTQAVYADLMKMVVTAIEIGKFSELNAGVPPLDLNTLSETCSWAKPQWRSA